MTPATPQEQEYCRVFELIRGDVETAVKSNHTYLTINNLVVADSELGHKINRFPDFWTLNRLALQTTFFIAFGRLFDKRRDAWSVPKLVDETISKSGLFSKAQLRERKLRVGLPGPSSIPNWLDESIQGAWEPTATDLVFLKTELEPYCDKFHAIYAPIRHSYYAHRGKEDEGAIAALFSKTQLGEVNEILRFLYTLVVAIQELANNGTRPDLTNVRSYEAYVANIKKRTEEFVHTAVAAER